MTNTPQTPGPTLHLFCGKIAAGKSTLARHLAMAPGTVLVSEDQWLSTLYGDEMASLEDYVRCSRRLRAVMGDHVGDLLRSGLSVVLDFPANTVKQRAWMRGIIETAGVAHRLHLLDVPDEVCKARMLARNRAGNHQFAPSEADFEAFSKHFAPPGPEEGFEIERHGVT